MTHVRIKSQVLIFSALLLIGCGVCRSEADAARRRVMAAMNSSAEKISKLRLVLACIRLRPCLPSAAAGRVRER